MPLFFDNNCDANAALGPNPGPPITDAQLRAAFAAVNIDSIHHAAHRQLVRRARNMIPGPVWVQKHAHQDTVLGGLHGAAPGQGRIGGLYNLHFTVRDVIGQITCHIYVQPFNNNLWIRGITGPAGTESFSITNV